MDRRKFLKRIAQIPLAFGLSRLIPTNPKISYGEITQETADIAIVTGDTKNAVNTAINLIGGIKKYVKPGNTVVLKPNMGFPNPAEMASTTNPEVIAEVTRLCIDAGAKKVLILDHPLRRPEVCLARNGIKDAVKELEKTNIFVITDKQFFKEVKIPKGKVLNKVEVLKDVLDSDVLINIPIAKSHNAAGVTLGMKGLMGLIWDREYFHEKVDLNQALADLSTEIKANLTIIDATRIMTSGGPAGPGTVEETHTIIAGTDPVAVDSAVVPLSKWYGQSFEAKNVKHIKLAYEMGIGEMDVNKLRVKRLKV